jgi:hypothetical protein
MGGGTSAGGGAGGGVTLPAGVTLRPIDGDSNYYCSHGFTYACNAGWDDPSFFPIGPWLAPLLTQSDVDRWKDVGFNTAFALTGDSPLSLLRSNGVNVIIQSDEYTRFGTFGSEVVGMMSCDECGTVAGAINTPLSTIPAIDQDARFWWFNNTWNFINYGDIGGVPAPQLLTMLVSTPNGMMRHIDTQSVDIYWFAGNGNTGAFSGQLLYNLNHSMTQDEMRRPAHYGDMVDRIRAYQTTYPGPLAQIVENGGPYSEDTTAAAYIKPAELNAAVWASIIHGARQIVYFNHSFGGPAQSDDNLAQTYYQTVQPGQTVSIYAQVKATNGRVKALAPIINSPFADGYVQVSPAATAMGGFDVMAKLHNNSELYVFALPRYSEGLANQTATFTIKNTGATSLTVVGENRTVSISNGTTFTDSFADGTTVHIYKVN